MTTVMPPTPVSADSVDDFLGAREGRFFGEGFKRVAHSLIDITVRAKGDLHIDFHTAGLEIPGTWSRKGDSHQRPHLSTIDALILGAQLTGLYLAHLHGAAVPFAVRSLAIKAGGKPQEEHLETFPVHGRHLSTVPDGAGTALTAVECRIGLITVRIEAEHGTGATRRTTEGRYTSPGELAGPWNDRPFGLPHRDRSQLLTAVEADLSRLTARADLAITTGTGADAEAERPTVIDLFVSALQLGQVLLYALDGVDRASSNTLWMRRTVVEPAADAGGSGTGRFEVALEDAHLLSGGQGTWRSADIVGALGGRRLRCSVAHLLPEASR